MTTSPAKTFTKVAETLFEGHEWQLRGVLGSLETEYAKKVKQAAEGTLRGPNGNRGVWISLSSVPDQKLRDRVKAELAKRKVRVDGFVAYCPCCNQTFDMPSQFTSLRENGLCDQCLNVAEGRSPGTIGWREPCVEEVLALPFGDIRCLEAEVLRKEILAGRKL